jgi:hypothetical protein
LYQAAFQVCLTCGCSTTPATKTKLVLKDLLLVSKGDTSAPALWVIDVWEQVNWMSVKAAFDKISEKENNPFDVRYTSRHTTYGNL